jgi:outer membrane immunogenic protein
LWWAKKLINTLSLNNKTIKTSLILILLINVTSTSAQNKLDKGQTQINVGLGFSNWGVPVFIGADWGAKVDITIGAEFSYRNFNEQFNKIQYRKNISGVLINGNYHFNTILDLPKEVDLYAGLNIGFYSWRYDNNYSDKRISGLGWGGQVGGRYFISKKIGINLEFGGGFALSGGKLGLTFKL